MARGGKRENAGRKKSSATLKTRDIADSLMTDGGIKPLEVLVLEMRRLWTKKEYGGAAQLAAMAAPYMHPRLTSVKVGGDPKNPTPITFAEVASSDAPAANRECDET